MTLTIAFFIFASALHLICLGAIALIWDQGEKTAIRLEKLISTIDQEIDQANQARATMPPHAPPPRAEPLFYLETKV